MNNGRIPHFQAGNGGLSPPGEAVDRQVLENIQSIQGAEVLHRVITLYLRDTPRVLQTLQEAADCGDNPVLRRSAHHLKSSSASLGAMRLATLCRELESTAKQGLTAAGAAMVREVVEEFNRVHALLERHIETGSTGP